MKIPFSDEGYDALSARILAMFPTFGRVGAAAYRPGLERMEEMCGLMGHPEKRFRSVHVAGTNGKGSSCNMLAAHFAGRGLRTGLYTSPHILDFRERIRVIEPGSDGHPHSRLVSRQFVWDFMQEYSSAIEDAGLSFFELTTAMAFAFFAFEGVEIAVVETGLGGRLDATNVIVPELSLITNIGYDHMDILGPTLGDIAREKAGIIKPGVPVVVGESHPETDPVFIDAAGRNGSPLIFADKSISGTGTLSPGDLDLKGIYQEKNLRTVLCALDALGEKADTEAICSSAAICDFHGRWEKICENPVCICDIGHNEHGLKYNFKQLDALLDNGSYTDLVMVYGSVKDKDVDAVLRILPSRAHIFFAAASNKRAMSSAELMRRAGHPRSESTASVAEAVGKALELCGTMAKPLLYIGGSTYVVSEALPLFK